MDYLEQTAVGVLIVGLLNLGLLIRRVRNNRLIRKGHFHLVP